MSLKFCGDCGGRKPFHELGCASVRAERLRARRFKVKTWSLASALQFAMGNATGKAAGALGPERSALGNVPGAARLCAWALRRAHDRGTVNP
jgi:hypothetical protein